MQYKIIIAQNQLSNYENYPFREHITQYIAFYMYIQNRSAKFAVKKNNMKNTAGLPNGWGA